MSECLLGVLDNFSSYHRLKSRSSSTKALKKLCKGQSVYSGQVRMNYFWLVCLGGLLLTLSIQVEADEGFAKIFERLKQDHASGAVGDTKLIEYFVEIVKLLDIHIKKVPEAWKPKMQTLITEFKSDLSAMKTSGKFNSKIFKKFEDFAKSVN